MVMQETVDAKAGAKARVDWVDYGKGLSIILVVLHHCIADPDKTNSPFWSAPFILFDETFALFRMPLFFLMAGIFAAKALRTDWPEFIDKKVIHFLYLFVLWSFITYVYTVVMPYVALGARSTKLDSILYIFVEPPRTLWFIYALLLMFLLTRILRSVPIGVLLLVSTVAYFVVIGDGLLLEVPFTEKLVRLYFFFLLGCWLSPYLQKARQFVRPWHLLLLVAYLAGAVLLVKRPEWQGMVIVFFCQLAGVAGGIVLAEMLSRGRFWGFVRLVGVYSLAVYVMHRLVLFTLQQVVKMVPALPPPEINILIALVLSLTLTIAAAKLIIRYRVPGLLEAPRWMSVRRGEKTAQSGELRAES